MRSVDEEGRKMEIKEGGVVARKLFRRDSLDIESSPVHGDGENGRFGMMLLHLAFQSIGVVYGDLGTSPLYVFSSTFPKGIKHEDDILGVLSLVLYTITLLPLIKYVFIVLWANDNGNGGIFALYSLLCRCAKVSLLPNQQAEDQQLSNYRLSLHTEGVAMRLKVALESNKIAKYVLLMLTMLGTSLVIGDGILTPSMSVLSAVGGIGVQVPSLSQDVVVWISVTILILLFWFQRFGTDKVGYSFAPIISIWFTANIVIGVYNFVKFRPSVIRALNPWYIYKYFKNNGKEGWVSLGGVVLCITGTEALFADLGHFTVRSIQISMSCVVYPSLLCAYIGQASYLWVHPQDVNDAFFKAIPHPVYWPMFIIAVLAAIIASQAMISGTFSIIKQSLSVGCFPSVTIVHTSDKHEGQVYIPELNNFLMVACVFVTIAFRTTEKIGNAYGIAVVFAECLTSFFTVLIMILLWKKNMATVAIYAVTIMSVEFLYLSAVLYKFPSGGYLPLAFAFFLMMLMFIWNYVFRKKYYYEATNKMSTEQLRDVITQANVSRLWGLAVFYSELVHGVPPIFEHYIDNVPAVHSVLVFVAFKPLPVSNILPEEQFLFRRIEPSSLYVFRCIVRLGYMDAFGFEKEPFEGTLLKRLREFVNENAHGNAIEDDIETLDEAARVRVVHLVGHSEVVANKESNLAKKIIVNNIYPFIKRFLRQGDMVSHMLPTRLLKVGMTYEI
ncbi:hypothetical protein V2J09_021067 [Rumex salicifolius]